MAELTAKQELFVREYLKDLNATQACIRAGYSERNAGKIGFQLIEKTRIKEAIAKANEKRCKKVDLTAEYVLNGLKENAVQAKEMKDFNASNKSYELLGKHLKLFTEKIESENTNINMSYEDYLKKVNDSDEY